jgi:hypothetical protein
LPTTTDALDLREYGVELGRLHSCERYFERAAEAAEAINEQAEIGCQAGR